MRTKEEMTDLMREIDNGKSIVMDKVDIQYIGDVTAVLQWMLKKLSAGQDASKVQEELKKKIEDTFLDALDGEEECKTFMDSMNREFTGHFKEWNASTPFNILDTFDWILEDVSTKQFLSDHFLNLK